LLERLHFDNILYCPGAELPISFPAFSGKNWVDIDTWSFFKIK
jgi:hypothetical protein